MIQVFINPPANPVGPTTGGIDRVVEAQTDLLQEYGINVVSNPDAAHVIANHGTMFEERPGVPTVCHNHGLYWSGYDWPKWVQDANEMVINSMLRSQAVTAPSRWVADAISRGVLFRPDVVYHGVDSTIWTPDPDGHAGYVLWNKARDDAVSSPRPMQELAMRMQNIPFVSTFGMPTQNVRVVGVLNRSTMRGVVRRAGLYLQTTRETMGISTLEALSSGVPIVGWNYGGQAEIVIQGETGYLAEPGNFEELEECIRKALADRDRLSANCRRDAEERWGWRDKIAQYAELYKRVAADWNQERPKVSIIVTTHNLARYLGDCLHSVQTQSLGDFEVVVVDDYSNDDPKSVVSSLNDNRFTYVRTRENVGLSVARNIGFRSSKGKYVLYLDADDMLDVAAIEILSDALDHDRGISIAYGHLDTVGESGEGRRRNEWPNGDFDWRAQISHLNQLPYSSMMRREVMELSGGYRERDWRAEDAAHWTRVTSLGLHAKMVTDRSTLVYRLRSDSKQTREHQTNADKDGDWTRFFPWRTGATNGREGEDVYHKNVRPHPNLVPFGAQGRPPGRIPAWPVHHHAHPTVSIVIPVCPSHYRFLTDSLDSCLAQSITDWEAIVVDDSNDGMMPESIPGHPFARVFYSHGRGAGAARNVGAAQARGKFLLFLDADDILEPNALERMLEAWLQYEGYIYCDCKIPTDPKRLDGPFEVIPAFDYDQLEFVGSGYSAEMIGRHTVTALIATEDFRRTRGFDEKLPFWEDWELYLQLAVLGIRGFRLPEALLLYRIDTGVRREASFKQEEMLREALRRVYHPYYTMEKEMCACTGGYGGTKAKTAAQNSLSNVRSAAVGTSTNLEDMENYVMNGKIRLHYIGERFGGIPYTGRKTRTKYVAGRDPAVEFVDVWADDAPDLLRTSDFEMVDVPTLSERMAWRD